MDKGSKMFWIQALLESINSKSISLDSTRLESTNQCCSVFRFLKESSISSINQVF
jgi:hypothetical protein